MKQAIVLDTNDIKNLIAEKYGVKPEAVIKSQYSFTVTLDNDEFLPPMKRFNNIDTDCPNSACSMH